MKKKVERGIKVIEVMNDVISFKNKDKFIEKMKKNLPTKTGESIGFLYKGRLLMIYAVGRQIFEAEISERRTDGGDMFLRYKIAFSSDDEEAWEGILQVVLGR